VGKQQVPNNSQDQQSIPLQMVGNMLQIPNDILFRLEVSVNTVEFLDKIIRHQNEGSQVTTIPITVTGDAILSARRGHLNLPMIEYRDENDNDEEVAANNVSSPPPQPINNQGTIQVANNSPPPPENNVGTIEEANDPLPPPQHLPHSEETLPSVSTLKAKIVKTRLSKSYYQVNKILAKRLSKGKVEYLIRWKGYSE
jgi:hypothetical protein